MAAVIHLYRTPALSDAQMRNLWSVINQFPDAGITEVETEICLNIEVQKQLTKEETQTLFWLLRETFEPEKFSNTSFLTKDGANAGAILEVGPRMSFTTAFSTNAVGICHACGLTSVTRLERSRRFLFKSAQQSFTLESNLRQALLSALHDRMTECEYAHTLTTFETGVKPEPVFDVPLVEEGRKALERVNKEMGLAFDEWDLDYYTSLFLNTVKRNPTSVECFDIAQSNSEHSRHWFFRGKLVIDGKEIEKSLMQLVKATLKANPNNSVIAFKDNSSAIRGIGAIKTVLPQQPGKPSAFVEREKDYDIIFTAETHNFPSGVAPFPGAETGSGGRIRDTHATGKGSRVVAGTAGYCVGNLQIPEYKQTWEDESFVYTNSLARPLQIEVDASNGASDYGNKFGEPLIQGFTRSFGMRLPNGERKEWVKPIMFSGGIGQIDHSHIEKEEAQPGMIVVKLGGPAYRIGIGGGAASSMVHGSNVADLDFNAVQRGDAEMEQKVNRAIVACIDLGDENPIVSIHDQGAGGSGNVLKEISAPAGAKIEVRNFIIGDSSLSVLEIWGAEYQEQDALLIRPEHKQLFADICNREKAPFAFVGVVTGDGKIVLHDEQDNTTSVDLPLELVLGNMPQKTFKFDNMKIDLPPLDLPKDLKVEDALGKVLRLLSVGSKRFLTNKVDRSVTGLIAQQQCVGPLHTPLSDVSVIAQSHFSLTGAATAIGEQPIKGIINMEAMARMTVGESLTNIMWARVSALQDIKCSGNWMWAAKLPGEGANLYNACKAMCDVMIQLGIAIDGGKDSLSMAAKCGDEIVKAPGELVVSSYVTCTDITKTVTPDFKFPGKGLIYYVDLSGSNSSRVGGSALAQVFNQIGDVSPDVDDVELVKRAFNTIQELIEERRIASGHDRSDGGLITTLLEMCFAGNCGMKVDIHGSGNASVIEQLFAEELGAVIEVTPENKARVEEHFASANIPLQYIGTVEASDKILVAVDGNTVLEQDMTVLRDIWEETSFMLEKRQSNPECVEQERLSMKTRKTPPYQVSFTPSPTSELTSNGSKPRVAIIREEGSNGDREMISAFHMAGFEAWDINMKDIVSGRISDLKMFRGVVFVGGFSYADVLDSAKGWAGTIRFNKNVWNMFEEFYHRKDTFSLGVCNGCQLMALLGWVPWRDLGDDVQPRFIHNMSGRYESRFSTVKITQSPSIMLSGMEGSTLGVWVAHGEGKAHFPESSTLEEVQKLGLAPVRYVDDDNEVTEKYPFNPNGAPFGIAALCSKDGRHLAMMPHPERTVLKWQWPYMSQQWKEELAASPWIKMFQNARAWCDSIAL